MIAINIPMPHNCYIDIKMDCPLLDDNKNCKLQPESRKIKTFSEQFEHCPLIDLTDDGK